MSSFVEVINSELKRLSSGNVNRFDISEFINFLNSNSEVLQSFNVFLKKSLEEGWSKKQVVSEISLLIGKHGISDLSFFKIHDAKSLSDLLVRNLKNTKWQDGRIVKVRSTGAIGGFYLISEEDAKTPEVKTDEKGIEEQAFQKEVLEEKERVLEADFYPAVRSWARNNGYPKCEEVGNSRVRYKWENPDLIHVEGSTSEITKSLVFDLVCFEVKLEVVPEAVWQAANYKLFSNYAYVAFAKSESEIRRKCDGRIFELAQSYGLGVLAWDSVEKKFNLILDPVVNQPTREKQEAALTDFSKIDSLRLIIEKAQKDYLKKIKNIMNAIE